MSQTGNVLCILVVYLVIDASTFEFYIDLDSTHVWTHGRHFFYF